MQNLYVKLLNKHDKIAKCYAKYVDWVRGDTIAVNNFDYA